MKDLADPDAFISAVFEKLGQCHKIGVDLAEMHFQVIDAQTVGPHSRQ